MIVTMKAEEGLEDDTRLMLVFHKYLNTNSSQVRSQKKNMVFQFGYF